MRYSIVSSSKGGTGKSSLSLALAIHYAHKTEKAPCLIDLDLLGTTLEISLFGKQIIKDKYSKDSKDYLEYIVDTNKIADKYLNDIVRHGFKSTDEIVTKVSLPYSRVGEKDDGAITEKAYIDILLASSSARDKKHFKKHSSTMGVAENVFANELKKILSHLEKQKYEHIIIDMPPASDLYSSCIYDLLLRNKDKDKTVDLYCISTDDSAQVIVCRDSTQAFLEDDNYHPPNKIIFAINKTLLSNKTPDNTDTKIYHDIYLNLKDSLLEKSYYISFNKCDKYTNCLSMGADNAGLYTIKIWNQTSMCRSLTQNGLHKIIKELEPGTTLDGELKFDESKVEKIELR